MAEQLFDERKRLSLDKIAPEGFFRGMLDRDMRQINFYFLQAFGPNKTPFTASVRRLQFAGRVALLDVGCGTGNGLRTWTTALQAVAPHDTVSAVGINLYDYSRESRFPETEAAIRDGKIRYIVGDAQNMSQVSSHSVDVVLACMSLQHMTEPLTAVSEMERITAVGGNIFFNVRGDHEISNSPLMEMLYEMEDEGYGINTRVGIVHDPTGTGSSCQTTFVAIEKPGILPARP